MLVCYLLACLLLHSFTDLVLLVYLLIFASTKAPTEPITCNLLAVPLVPISSLGVLRPGPLGFPRSQPLRPETKEKSGLNSEPKACRQSAYFPSRSSGMGPTSESSEHHCKLPRKQGPIVQIPLKKVRPILGPVIDWNSVGASILIPFPYYSCSIKYLKMFLKILMVLIRSKYFSNQSQQCRGRLCCQALGGAYRPHCQRRARNIRVRPLCACVTRR